MSTLRLLTVSCAASVAVWSGVACAQVPEGLASPPLVPPAVPAPMAPVSPPTPMPTPNGPSDLELRAIGASPVDLHMADGTVLPGQIVGSDGMMLVVRLRSTGQVLSVPRAQVVQLTMQAPQYQAVQPEQAAAPQVPTKPRHVGIAMSVVPGVALDFDYGMFRAFANVGILLPLATSGEAVPLSFGIGAGIPLSKRYPSFKLDVMGYAAMLINAKNYSYSYASSSYNRSPEVSIAGVGLGVGLHYTWNNGFTLGGMVPILGAAVHLAGAQSPDIAERTAMHFLASAASMPLFYLGYRF